MLLGLVTSIINSKYIHNHTVYKIQYMYLRSSDRNDLNIFFKFGTDINSAVAWISSMAKRIHSYCNLLLELDFP